METSLACSQLHSHPGTPRPCVDDCICRITLTCGNQGAESLGVFHLSLHQLYAVVHLPVRWAVGSEAAGIAVMDVSTRKRPRDGGPSLGAVMSAAADVPRGPPEGSRAGSGAWSVVVRVAVGRLVSLSVPREDVFMGVFAAEQNLTRCGASYWSSPFTLRKSLLMERPGAAIQKVTGLPSSRGWG